MVDYDVVFLGTQCRVLHLVASYVYFHRKRSPVIIPKESLANLDTLMSSVGNSIGNAPSSNERRKNEEMMIHQKEEWSHHGWYLWKRVEKEENRKLATTVQELATSQT